MSFSENSAASDEESGGCCVFGRKKTHWYAATTTTSSTSVTATSTTTTSSCLGKTEQRCFFYCYKPSSRSSNSSLSPKDVAQLGNLLQKTKPFIDEQPTASPKNTF
jgi:hypothetical protein